MKCDAFETEFLSVESKNKEVKMGFGFNLFFILILVPTIGILIITWALSQKLIFGKLLGLLIISILAFMMLSGTVIWINSKTVLDKDDYRGEYIINRNYFPGKQTDWQYDHFRFTITNQDSIFFYYTDKEKILKTYRGKITTTDPNNNASARLIINMEKPTHHISVSNPTTFRSAWGFYLVFESPEFHNVFFKKGKWKSYE